MFSEFKPVSKTEWLAKVEKDLKGKKTIDTFNWEIERKTISPFHHKDDGNSAAPLVNGRKKNSWEIGERIVVEDYKKANQQALSALSKGANALLFVLLENTSKANLNILLKDIQHEWISTHFLSVNDTKSLIDNFIKTLEQKKQNPANVDCSFNLKDIEQLPKWVNQLPKGRFVETLPCNVSNPNASVLSEKLHSKVSTVIKWGNDLLIQMHQSGLDISKYHHHIQFSIDITDDYFVSIAKIRALKILWQQILKEWTVETLQCNVSTHIIPNTTDENYNKIKTTTQAMSAVIGGADRLYIYPSDHQNNPNGTSFSRRIALNVQHLMQQESYLDRVVDPAGGSYYIEELTNRIAEKAWSEFQKM